MAKGMTKAQLERCEQIVTRKFKPLLDAAEAAMQPHIEATAECILKEDGMLDLLNEYDAVDKKRNELDRQIWKLAHTGPDYVRRKAQTKARNIVLEQNAPVFRDIKSKRQNAIDSIWLADASESLEAVMAKIDETIKELSTEVF